MQVQGLIQAAGSGTRLGLGPKAFVRLAGRTLLEHAVALLAGVADELIVAVPPADRERAEALVGGPAVRILAGAPSRSATTRQLIEAAQAPWLLLHDVVHPLATPALVGQVLARARACGAAAPGVDNADFLYRPDGSPLHPPGAVLVGQKPVAFALAAVRQGYAALDAAGQAGDPSLLEVLERGGLRTAFVPGSSDNVKITTAADLRIAQALLALQAEDGPSP